MARTSYDEQLQELKDDLIRMGSITQKQIYESIEALVKQDEKLADKIIKNDDIVDNIQREIEDKCIRLIAMQQPIATDLRNIFTTTKIVNDLERMADYAVNISKIAIRLKDEVYIKQLEDIPKMSLMVSEMIDESIESYINGDVKKAYEICKKDDGIDEIYKQVFDELIALMMKDMSVSNQATQFLFICKYLERVADHVTNICESTIYLVTGVQKDMNE